MVTTKQVLMEFKPHFKGKVPKKPSKIEKFNIYYWHRRYPIHKFLNKKANIWEKLKNGDFDYSPYAKYINYEYYWMSEEIAVIRNSNKDTPVKFEEERDLIKSYNRRIENLTKDFERDEKERLENLQFSLQYTFGGSKEEIQEYIFQEAMGSLEEIIRYYPKWKKVDESVF